MKMRAFLGMVFTVGGTYMAFTSPHESNEYIIAAIFIVGGIIITFMKGD